MGYGATRFKLAAGRQWPLRDLGTDAIAGHSVIAYCSRLQVRMQCNGRWTIVWMGRSKRPRTDVADTPCFLASRLHACLIGRIRLLQRRRLQV